MNNVLNLNESQSHTPQDAMIDIYWLGGSGFIMKFDNGVTVCVDPYLSDSVERLFGFKRLIPVPISADQLKCDILLISHEHGDHLDIDSFDAIYAGNTRLKIFAPASCDEFLCEHNAKYTQIKTGDCNNIEGINIKSLKADHGELSPDALGFMLTYKERTIYLTGDTGFNLEILKPAIDARPEIIIPCINGAYGNLDEEQSSELVKLCGSKIAIPTHYGLFNEHGGDADKFIAKLQEISPQTKAVKLNPASGTSI